MPETGVLTTTEAAGVFREVASFQAAINDLLFAGFDHADINVLAHEDTVRQGSGANMDRPLSLRTSRSTADRLCTGRNDRVRIGRSRPSRL